MTQEIRDFDFTHEDVKKMTHIHNYGEIWPDQLKPFLEGSLRGRPRAVVGWKTILSVIEEGIKDVCNDNPLRYQILHSYKRLSTASQLAHRFKKDYINLLPSGIWDFRVSKDAFEDLHYVMGRYTPQKFSDIENIENIPEEQRIKMLADLHEYAEKKRQQAP